MPDSINITDNNITAILRLRNRIIIFASCSNPKRFFEYHLPPSIIPNQNKKQKQPSFHHPSFRKVFVMPNIKQKTPRHCPTESFSLVMLSEVEAHFDYAQCDISASTNHHHCHLRPRAVESRVRRKVPAESNK
jgi:hypothetical protein